MPSTEHYRIQALRCVLLSRSTADTKARLWLTDMASYYAAKAEAAAEQYVPTLAPSDNIAKADPSGENGNALQLWRQTMTPDYRYAGVLSPAK
jgi:hypothetical protein